MTKAMTNSNQCILVLDLNLENLSRRLKNPELVQLDDSESLCSMLQQLGPQVQNKVAYANLPGDLSEAQVMQVQEKFALAQRCWRVHMPKRARKGDQEVWVFNFDRTCGIDVMH